MFYNKSRHEDEEMTGVECTTTVATEYSSSSCSSECEDEYSSGEEVSCKDDNWVDNFLDLPGHEMYLRVPNEFMRDEFNLTNINKHIKGFRYALDILSNKYNYSNKNLRHYAEMLDMSAKEVKAAIKVLYIMIHVRFISSKAGLNHMLKRYESGYYGTCPRYLCSDVKVLPVGSSNEVDKSAVQMYCPSCNDIYTLPSTYNKIDGAAFGTSFPHIFTMTFPEHISINLKTNLLKFSKDPEKENIEDIRDIKAYTPRIFGFEIYKCPFSDLADPKHEKIRDEGRCLSCGTYSPESYAKCSNISMAWLRRTTNYNRHYAYSFLKKELCDSKR